MYCLKGVAPRIRITLSVIGEELQYRWQCKCMQSKTSCMGSCIAEIAEAGLTVWMGGGGGYREVRGMRS